MKLPHLPWPAAALAIAIAGCSSPAPTVAPTDTTSSDPAVAASPATQATIVAQNVAFTTTSLTLAPGAPIHLVFQNADNGIPHNLHISGSGQDVVKSDIVVGPATLNLDLAPLAPGAYGYLCDIHPNMTGTITVPAP